jgi:hypothetical protein
MLMCQLISNKQYELLNSLIYTYGSVQSINNNIDSPQEIRNVTD